MQKPETNLKEIIMSCKQAFIYVAIFSCIVNILTLTVAVYMLQLYDRVLISYSYDTLIYLTLIAVFALGILAGLDWVRSRMLVFISHWLDNKLSPEALRRSVDNILQGQNYAYQSLRDVNTIRSFLAGSGTITILDSPWVPIYLFVIFLLNPWLGFMGVLGAAIILGLAILNERTTKEILMTANTSSIKTQQHIGSTLRNAESIQAMGMLSHIIERWFADNEKVLQLQTLASERSGAILAFSKFFRFLIQVLMLGLGAYFVITNEMTAGGMIAASIVLSRALQPIEQSIGIWQQFTHTRQAYKRLSEYFQLPLPRVGEIVLPRPDGLLTFENVTLIPPGSTRIVLKAINFRLTPGETLAIIGPSAAGKTCIARLIVGAWAPTGGSVRLDGSDVYSWNRDEFGKYLGYLPQVVELFIGTVKDNIARMQYASDEDIIFAGKLSGAHALILHLPDGYDTKIGEGGYKLSGGQQQRIALARAMFGKPALLVLDEPYANLDSEGELALSQSLEKIKKLGSTVVFITNRPEMIELADKVLYLQEGQLQLFGNKADVLAKLRELNILRSRPSAPTPGASHE